MTAVSGVVGGVVSTLIRLEQFLVTKMVAEISSNSKIPSNLDTIGWMRAIVRSYKSHLRGVARANETSALILLSDQPLDFVIHVRKQLDARL